MDDNRAVFTAAADPASKTVQAIVFKGTSGQYVSAFVNTDMVAQGCTGEDAATSLAHTFAMHEKWMREEKGDPSENLRAAPPHFSALAAASPITKIITYTLPKNNGLHADKMVCAILDNPRVVIYSDDGCILAQALEIDISAQGKTDEEAYINFLITLAEEINFRGGPEKAFKEIGPAPDVFHELWGSEKVESIVVTEMAPKAAI